MKRPDGITVLAFVMFTAAALLLIFGAFCLTSGAVIAEMLRMPLMPVANSLGAAAVGIIAIIFAVFSLVAGIGLWTVRAWGRALSFALVILCMALMVVGLAGALAGPNILLAMRRTVVLAVDAMILWYLTRGSVRSAFGSGG